MREFDFSPLFRSAIGFDGLPSMLDSARRSASAADAYPPYNIEKLGDDEYRISVAVAGFGPEDLNVEVRDATLIVAGKGRAEEPKLGYLHRGIAGRAFERRFQLAEHVEARAADLVNGMLVIDLVREVPEALKPRRIEIRSGGAKAIDHKTAA